MSKNSKAKVNSAMAVPDDEGPLSIEETLKLLREAGFIDGNAEDRGGGIVIVGGVRPPSPSPTTPTPTRKGRIKEFTRHLKLMARRAKKGDCYIVFEVKGKRRTSGTPDRFLQFWFGPKSFHADLPKTTFGRGEAKSLVASRPGFYFRNTRRVPEDQADYVKKFNPVFRQYKYGVGDEGLAAEDMAYILFDLWKLPVDHLKIDVTAARADE